MKILLSVVISAVLLTGCVSQQELSRRQDAAYEAQSRLESARNNAIVVCPNKPACDKAFALAKIYVQDNADMKIQFSDDTMAYTYNPIQSGLIGLSVTKKPGSGETSTIALTASCKGINGLFFDMCAQRMTPVYEYFKTIVESGM